MEIGMVIQEFGFDCRIRKLSPKTIENYGKQLSYLQRYLAEEHGIAAIEAVRSIHIKQFLAMMDDRGRKPQYINDLLKVFKTFFNYCEKEGHVKASPAAGIRNMKQPKTVIMTFSEGEIRGLLNYYNLHINQHVEALSLLLPLPRGQHSRILRAAFMDFPFTAGRQDLFDQIIHVLPSMGKLITFGA